MGYYTDYELNIIPPDQDNIIYNELLNTCEAAAYELSNSQQSTWDTAEQDLKEFSKKYPEHLFVLEGHGQEFDDVWQLHVQDGDVKKFKGEIWWVPVS